MNPLSKSLQWLVWGGLVLTIAAIVVAFVVKRRGESDTRAGLLQVNGRPADLAPLPLQLHDFTLTNQYGQPITRADLRGQLCLVDIIFTRCAGPCPEMTRRMADLQAAIPTGQPVKFVTLTTDPEHDTPAVLQTYTRRFGAETGRWHLLTWSKNH